MMSNILESEDRKLISKTLTQKINNQDVIISYTFDLTEDTIHRIQRILLESSLDSLTPRGDGDNDGITYE